MSLPVSGFTAVPNPVMIPFMVMQSSMMMYAAGYNWQMGKRKASAKSNEEVNGMSAQDMAAEVNSMIVKQFPEYKSFINQFDQFVQPLMQEFADVMREMIKAMPATAAGSIPRILTEEQNQSISPTAIAQWLSNIGNIPQAGASGSVPNQPLPDTFTQHQNIRNNLPNYDNMTLGQLRTMIKSMQQINRTDTIEYRTMVETFNRKANEARSKTTVQSTRTTTPVTTRQPTKTELEFRTWNKKAVSLMQDVLSRHRNATQLQQSLNNPASALRKMNITQQRQYLRNLGNRLSSAKLSRDNAKRIALNYYRLGMNSNNHLIKSNASRMYKEVQRFR